MAIIKFDHSVKYNGVRYAAHEAFKAENKDVPQLKEAGAIVLNAEEPETAYDSEDEKHTETENAESTATDVSEMREKLLEYTLAELIQFAKDNNIDLQDKTRKADIYNVIIAAIQ